MIDYLFIDFNNHSLDVNENYLDGDSNECRGFPQSGLSRLSFALNLVPSSLT